MRAEVADRAMPVASRWCEMGHDEAKNLLLTVVLTAVQNCGAGRHVARLLHGVSVCGPRLGQRLRAGVHWLAERLEGGGARWPLDERLARTSGPAWGQPARPGAKQARWRRKRARRWRLKPR